MDEVVTMVTVQLPPAAIVPPLKVTLVAVEETVPAPHCEAAGAAERTRFAGKLSVNATPDKAVLELGLVMVKVSVLVLPEYMGLGENDFEIDGGASTVNVALAEPPTPVFVPDSALEIKPLVLL